MATPNTSEKSNYIDREENITRGNLSAKKVAVYSYDADSDTLVNSIPTTSPALRTELDDQTPIIYIGKAQIGSDITDPVWQIAKLDTSSGLSKTWAGSGFDQIWADRTTLTYN
jgi:hypothetical protein